MACAGWGDAPPVKAADTLPFPSSRSEFCGMIRSNGEELFQFRNHMSVLQCGAQN